MILPASAASGKDLASSFSRETWPASAEAALLPFANFQDFLFQALAFRHLLGQRLRALPDAVFQSLVKGLQAGQEPDHDAVKRQ